MQQYLKVKESKYEQLKSDDRIPKGEYQIVGRNVKEEERNRDTYCQKELEKNNDSQEKNGGEMRTSCTKQFILLGTHI